MFRSLFALAALACLPVACLHPVAWAAEGFVRVPPTPADQAEQSFEVLHGFRMELIAAEPLVVDPVDLAYDEDGRAYVVEMRDYPYPEEKNASPTVFPGTVRLLEDADGDGRFDKSTIFADQLAWPTSVACWKGGVFVAAAPDIWYFKDTDGDRRADIRRKVFTGFGRYNVQAIMNNLRWSLDNKLYGAAAGNGGSVRHAERADEPAVSLARRDFRFDPASERFEAISGGERFGNAFDDWGNRFVCNIRNPVQHVVLPQHYLARNPNLIVPAVVHDCAESGDQLRVFRLSPPEPWRLFRAQRWSLEGVAMPRSELIGAGYWTSSSGVTIYRGGAYPAEFRGNVFIGEVAGNLVHRQVLTRDGVTFTSQRADENTEFIRSRDNWFRPVNFVNAPDGTLHVLDMYRETIEHPWSIPDDIKAQLDLSSGNDRGRIYRLAPPDFAIPKPPKLSTATTAELVAHLASPHSWWRETAQRLLVERQDKEAAEPLRQLLQTSPQPLARLHALYTLAGLNALQSDDLRAALRDESPGIVRHAIHLAEGFPPAATDLAELAPALAQHADAGVRFQTALWLGSLKGDAAAVESLAQLARRDGNDPYLRAAILSSSHGIADSLALALLASSSPPAEQRGRAEIVRQLAFAAASGAEQGPAKRLLDGVANRNDAQSPELTWAVLAGIGQGAARRKEKLADYLPQLEPAAAQRVAQLLEQVLQIASAADTPPAERLAAIDLLAYLPWSDARPALSAATEPTAPGEVQRSALRVLGTFAEAEIAADLVVRWNKMTPPLREESVALLLSRPVWHEPLVAALESGAIPLAQVSIPHRGRLAALKDAALAERTKILLASVALGPRQEMIGRYEPALAQKSDAARGQVVYRRECANCHRLGGEGHEVGPNLATIVHRSPPEILIHVLDPNREVSPNFLDYAVLLADGRVLTGLIASETDSGLTLRRAEQREDTILRSEIANITSSGKSLMPEGLEQKISVEEMGDLIGFLRQPTSPAP